MNRSPLVLSYLLTLLALLMGIHLLMLTSRDQACRQYERVLVERLLKTAPDSQQARNLRNEIQNFFGGRYSDCSSTGAAFSDTADKYLAVILSLLTGAGVAAATVDRNSIAQRLLDRREERRESDRDVDG